MEELDVEVAQLQPPDWSKLPPELWCIILIDNLSQPQDLSNVLLACPHLWDKILHPRKPDFLFPFVLSIIAEKRRYLGHHDVLNCRLVCSSWKSHVDNHLKSHDCLMNLDGINHEKKDCCIPVHVDSSYCWQRAATGVQTSAEIHSILQKLEAYPNCNQFLTRCLEFRDFTWDPAISWEIAPEIWDDLRTLLNKVGPSILHFRFLSAAQRTGPVFYKYIRELLQLLPNLRTLRLWFVAGPGDIMVPQCEQLIQSNPLPDMEHLTVIKSVHLPTVIMNALLKKYANQLDKLEILSLRRHSHLYSYEEDSTNGSSAKLEELSIRLWSVNDIWKMNNSGLLSPSLKSLNVFVDLSFETDSLEKLFYVLSSCKASDSLEKLSVEILMDNLGPVKKMVDPQTRLKLPLLKKLKINCKLRCLNTVDFILDMELLEEFVLIMENIHIKYKTNSTGSGTSGLGRFPPGLLKFVGNEDCLYESNIWKLLPKLRRIQITDEIVGVGEEENDGDFYFFDRDTSTNKRYFRYNRLAWEELQNKS